MDERTRRIKEWGRQDERARIVAWLREHGWDDRYTVAQETAHCGIVYRPSPGKLADAIEQGAHTSAPTIAPEEPTR